MDEILATIRRIIAEDERSSGAGDRSAPDEGPRAAEVGHEEAVGVANVLDLTDVLNEDGSVHRLAPLAARAGVPEPGSAPASTDTEVAAPAAVPATPPEADPTTDRDVRDEAALAIDRAAGAGPAPAATKSPGANDERLVSDVAALAAATAFGRIAAVPRARGEPPLVGERPLDEIVRELLRPLLRTWLDEHLPGIVERLVQAEIARISARSGPG